MDKLFRKKPLKPAFGFIFLTIALDVLSLGIMIPVLPNLVKTLNGGDTAAAATWLALFVTSWGAMQFVFGPILGTLSDRYGRRPIILMSLFCMAADFLYMAFAPTLWLLYVGRIFNGITAASMPTASAYIADITPPESRAKRFGLIGAAFGFGITFGPALGGWLGQSNPRIPFFVCAGLAFCNWLYGFFVLPESLPAEARTKQLVWRRANPLGSLRLMVRNKLLIVLGSINFLFQLSLTALMSIFVLYLAYRYHWSPESIGLVLMVGGIAGIIVQAVLVGPVVKWVGEQGALLIGLVFGVFGFVIFAFAPTGNTYLVGVIVFSFSGFIQPAVMGLMTRQVGRDEQGELQGANAASMGIASIIGPSIYGPVFAWSLRHDAFLHQPGFAILVAASFMLLGLLIALRLVPSVRAERADLPQLP